MPSLGWKVGDETYTYDEAYLLARKEGFFYGFPPAALRAMENHRTDGLWLSPSAAGGCPKQRILKFEKDYYTSLERAWTPMVGNAIHTILAGKGEDEEAEATLSCSLSVTLRNGEEVASTLVGTPDSYDPESRRVFDYKTVTTWRSSFPEEHHIIQLQLYYYLLARNGHKVDELILWYVKQSVSSGELRRQAFSVEPWDLQDIEAIAEELAEPLMWYQKTGEYPHLNEGDMGWMCLVCPVAQQCREVYHTNLRSLPF